MKVIYLVGMGRSGSTLLDILLDAHSSIRSLGGVNRLAHYASRHPCACGAPSFLQCEFWTAANAELQRRHGRQLTNVAVRARDRVSFERENQALFESAAAVEGVHFVTDNSKSVSRLKRLIEAPGIDVIPVHVVRDPRGRAQSIRKRKGQRYIPTFSYTYRSLRLYFLLKNHPHITVSYEEFVADPERNLKKLMERIGLDFESQQLRWAEQPHHNIGSADVLRKTEGSAIRPDDAWEKDLPNYMQKIVNFIAYPGRVANEKKKRVWGL